MFLKPFKKTRSTCFIGYKTNQEGEVKMDLEQLSKELSISSNNLNIQFHRYFSYLNDFFLQLSIKDGKLEMQLYTCISRGKE